MSWETTFYLGIMDKDKKIRPLGPFDNNGDYKSVFFTSRSFTTDLKDSFEQIEWEQVTDELNHEFHWKSPDSELFQYFGYLSLDKLPKGEWIKRGYFLKEQVDEYLENGGDVDFYMSLTPERYLLKLENELKFGAPKPKEDEDGETWTEPSCAEYVYFCYPDYNCKEYEANLLRTTASILRESWELKDGEQIVVIKTEG